MELTKTINAKGYKQTEIGLIPVDWEVKDLGSAAKLNMGQSPPSSNYNNVGLGLPLVQGNADVKNRKTIIRNFTSQITKKASAGEIIMSVRAPVGEIAKTDFECCIGRGVCSISYENEYLYHYLVSFEGSWGKFSTGSTFDSVNSNQVKSIQIPLPPLSEQKAIANALSDVDALLLSLDKQIAKKKAIKQGAMQELLTPKEGWEVKKLGDLIEILADYTANGSFESLKVNVTYYSDKNYAVLVRTTDLDKPIFEPQRFTDKQGYDFLSKTSLKGGELILANVGSVGKVFKVPFYEMPMTLAPNTYMIKFYKSICQNFIYQWMLTEEFKTKLLSKIGSTTLLAINKDNLKEIVINIPNNLEEQTRIAEILSDMDLEIASLEAKRQKYVAIKQGMMQELLTGRTRLV